MWSPGKGSPRAPLLFPLTLCRGHRCARDAIPEHRPRSPCSLTDFSPLATLRHRGWSAFRRTDAKEKLHRPYKWTCGHVGRDPFSGVLVLEGVEDTGREGWGGGPLTCHPSALPTLLALRERHWSEESQSGSSEV